MIEDVPNFDSQVELWATYLRPSVFNAKWIFKVLNESDCS